ncbi:putative receptor-like protein kinase [Arachis hypogaea]|nr:putative receptor-like protein kinase [Arachis hypogaea]
MDLDTYRQTSYDGLGFEAVTNSFNNSNVIAESSSRIAYRAHLDKNFHSAIKKADSDADREFKLAEQDSALEYHKTHGYCIHGESKFLVYELMENGSLETQLHGPNRGSSLTWYLRLRIAVDAARIWPPILLTSYCCAEIGTVGIIERLNLSSGLISDSVQCKMLQKEEKGPQVKLWF